MCDVGRLFIWLVHFEVGYLVRTDSDFANVMLRNMETDWEQLMTWIGGLVNTLFRYIYTYIFIHRLGRTNRQTTKKNRKETQKKCLSNK